MIGYTESNSECKIKNKKAIPKFGIAFLFFINLKVLEKEQVHSRG
jgi:hypothetical protein